MSTPFSISADLELGARIAPFLSDGSADVVIRAGDVPESLDDAEFAGVSYQVSGEEFLLKVPNGVRFIVRGGEEIIYQRKPDVTDREVALFLLGSAWGALCFQRDLLPLHASAVLIDGRVYAFTGQSGAGKSTLAAALSDRGYDFFADDTVIIDTSAVDGEVLCYAGQKDLKLWNDALELTNAEKTVPVRERKPLAKFFANPRSADAATVGDLASLTILSTSKERAKDGECSIESLKGGTSIAQLADSVYRPNFAIAIWGRKKLYQALGKVIQTVAVSRFHRPMVKSEFTRGLDFIDAWLASECDRSDDQSDQPERQPVA